MSLLRELRKHPERLTAWHPGFGAMPLPTDEARLLLHPDGAAPVYVDVTGVEMGAETMGLLDLERHGEIGPPFSDAWIEWHDQAYAQDGPRVSRAATRVRHLRGAGPHSPGESLLVQGVAEDPERQRSLVMPWTYVHLSGGCLVPGAPGETKSFLSTVLVDHAARGGDDLRAIREGLRRSLVGIALYTYLLLNCRNIALAPTQPRAPRWQGRSGKIGLEWHRLVVVPTRRLRELGDSKVAAYGVGEPVTRAHLVRGHFKTFSPERPLFGRWSGRYWWSPAERGDRARGVVLKDYEVRG